MGIEKKKKGSEIREGCRVDRESRRVYVFMCVIERER